MSGLYLLIFLNNLSMYKYYDINDEKNGGCYTHEINTWWNTEIWHLGTPIKQK